MNPRPLLLLPVILMGCASVPWSRADTMRQGAVVVLQVADWGQTRTISQETWPGTDFPRWREKNVFLGAHPSRGEVDLWFAGCIVGNVAIARALPRPYREIWQWASIITQAYFVGNNYRIGVKW